MSTIAGVGTILLSWVCTTDPGGGFSTHDPSVGTGRKMSQTGQPGTWLTGLGPSGSSTSPAQRWLSPAAWMMSSLPLPVRSARTGAPPVMFSGSNEYGVSGGGTDMWYSDGLPLSTGKPGSRLPAPSHA